MIGFRYFVIHTTWYFKSNVVCDVLRYNCIASHTTILKRSPKGEGVAPKEIILNMIFDDITQTATENDGKIGPPEISIIIHKKILYNDILHYIACAVFEMPARELLQRTIITKKGELETYEKIITACIISILATKSCMIDLSDLAKNIIESIRPLFPNYHNPENSTPSEMTQEARAYARWAVKQTIREFDRWKLRRGR